ADERASRESGGRRRAGQSTRLATARRIHQANGSSGRWSRFLAASLHVCTTGHFRPARAAVHSCAFRFVRLFVLFFLFLFAVVILFDFFLVVLFVLVFVEFLVGIIIRVVVFVVLILGRFFVHGRRQDLVAGALRRLGRRGRLLPLTAHLLPLI